MKRFAIGKLLTAAVLLSASVLSAASYRAYSVAIPFEFKVRNTMFPAGHYYVQDGPYVDSAYLVNEETGRRIHLLRPTSMHTPGKARLVFKDAGGDRFLAEVR